MFDFNEMGHVLMQKLAAHPDQAKTALKQMGFQDPERALHNLEILCDPRLIGTLPGSFFRDVVDVPDPDMALNNFERLFQVVFSRSAFLHQLHARPEMCRLLLQVLGGSAFMADILVRDPESFYWLIENPECIGHMSDKTQLKSAFEGASLKDQTHRLNAVRRAARRELLRIGVGDLACGRLIQNVAADLSVLADVCLQTVIDILLPDLDRRYGIPKQADGQRAQFAVIGLGKLGGMELNFSSDIDVMFVYSEDGQTDGDIQGRPVSNQVYFTRLCERLVQVVTECTEEGFLYRMDMRLRPDGAAGALTMPLKGYEGYYMRRGELWERQMLIKARLCAGSKELGERFLKMVQPFVYPRHFDHSPTVEIRRIKGRIESRIGRKGQGQTHLKLRAGGIRDIEFIVQCLQLLVGRVQQNARSDNTLQAIWQLQRVWALSQAEADVLRGAYVFFRRLEHRMQMMHNRSDYVLSDDPHHQQVMARTMGFGTIDAYQCELERHLTGVQAIYADVFDRETDTEGRSVGALVEMEVGDDEAIGLLQEIGFSRPQEAHRNLIYMAFGHVPRIRGMRARQSFTELAPALMQALQKSADPDQGLSHLERLVFAYGAGDMLFRLLTTNRGFRDLMLALCVGSSYLVNVMVRNPGLLDWLLQPDVLHQNPSAKTLLAELRDLSHRSENPDALTGAFNRLKSRELLRIGARDLLGLTDTFETFEVLTVLADALVQMVYDVVFARLVHMRGMPQTATGNPAAFVILGLGKMGGRELNFGSDLDLVFVYSEDGQTDGNNPQGNLQFFVDLAQQITAVLDQNTAYGKLYPVDARLRPEGGNALLVLSFDAYDSYLKRRASTWERLALSRSRVVAGDRVLGERLLDRFEEFVVGKGFSDAEVATMCDIRKRMEKKGGTRTGLQPSLKTDPGGMVDIEFIAQILQLKHAALHKQVRSANTPESLDKLSAAGFLDAEDARFLKQTFGFLRTVEKVLRRQNEQARTRLPDDERALMALSRVMGFESTEAFMAQLTRVMAQTRAVFIRLIGKTDMRS